MNARPRPDSRDDAQLVRAATVGDRNAFAAIYDRYADRLHDFCWGLLRDRDEAADATQDAFLVAAERLGQLRDPERLRPWLYAVARNAIVDNGRAKREPPVDAPDEVAGDEGPAERAESGWIAWRVHRALAELPENERQVIELAYWGGRSQSEIADLLGIPLGTVKTRTRTGLSRLAAVLEDVL